MGRLVKYKQNLFPEIPTIFNRKSYNLPDVQNSPCSWCLKPAPVIPTEVTSETRKPFCINTKLSDFPHVSSNNTQMSFLVKILHLSHSIHSKSWQPVTYLKAGAQSKRCWCWKKFNQSPGCKILSYKIQIYFYKSSFKWPVKTAGPCWVLFFGGMVEGMN